MTRTDATVNFAWATGTPAPGVGADTFSVRWSGYIKPKFAQIYTFFVNHDDGARLWVNGQLVLDQWATVGEQSGSTGVAFQAGVLYPIRLEYFDNVSTATAKLYWQSSSQAKQIIPQARLYPSISGPTPMPTRSPTATPTSATATPFTGSGISSIVTQGNWDDYSIDFSHTVEAGPNRLLVLTLAYAAGADPYQMTFDDRLMTSAVGKCDRGANYACAAIYYLVDPPVGTYNVHLSFSNGGKIMAGVMTLYGIDQTNPLVATGTDMNYDSGSTASVDLASQPGDLAVDVISTRDCSAGFVTPGAGQTERWSYTWTNPNWTRRASTSSEIATGSTVNMSHAGASGNGCPWAYVAGLFRAAQNVTPTPTMTASPSPTVTPTVASMPSGVIWRSHYFAGAQRVAMRVVGDPVPANNGVFYILGDHLGSTNVIVDEDGTKVTELRYKAWGETRFTSGAAGTDYRYTGQREEAGIGLYYYNARWYREASRSDRRERRDDPVLGRFAQADTIVPGGGPMAWDRYAYVSNNPLRLVDPTGHWEDEGCGQGALCNLPASDRSQPPRSESEGRDDKQPDEPIRIDYFVGSASLSLAVIYPALLPVNVTVQLIRDAYGNWYWAVGPGLGEALTLISGDISGGALQTDLPPTEEQLEAFVLGSTAFVNAGYIAGGGVTWGHPSLSDNPRIEDFAVELGAYSPQIGGSYVYGLWIYDANTPTPWFWQSWLKQ